MDIFDIKSVRKVVEDLEKLKVTLDHLILMDIYKDLTKYVCTSVYEIANESKPILITQSIYNCVAYLAYDLKKKYAFLAHSYGNEAYGYDNSTSPSQIYQGIDQYIPEGVPEGSSVHVIDMLDTISKEDLYNLKVCIILGSKPNVPLVSSMINTSLALGKSNISIESIKLIKPFIEGVNCINDVNYGKDKNYFELSVLSKGKEIVKNNITGDYHIYDKTRGSSFGFDVRDGSMYTYNPDTDQYYKYNENLSIRIK